MRPLLCVLHVGLSTLFATHGALVHARALVRAAWASSAACSTPDLHCLPHSPSSLPTLLPSVLHDSAMMGPKGLISPLVMGPEGLITPVASSHPNVMTPHPTIALVMGLKGLISCLLAPKFNDRPTIALVMGLKGLISRLLAPKFNDRPTIALVMGLKGLISRLLAPKFNDICPALLVLFPPCHTPHPSSLPPPFTPAPHHSAGHGAQGPHQPSPRTQIL
ncbi:unnamed protein product [Closterium sp. Naga37s-1]|nr:unnamed protein product [Closterium sp. Naga37s-1]